jgi:hypothetical protein
MSSLLERVHEARATGPQPARRFGFSSAILAVVFATYASVLVPATAVGAAIWHGRTAR